MIARERFGIALSPDLLQTIQQGTLNYTYKGVPTLKNPFDFALYPKLLWQIRPRTIFEIGSNRGGSALWLSDLMRTFSLPFHVHSIDINKVTDLQIPDVTFHRGDARNLEKTLLPEMLEKQSRPFLIIEDSDHQAQTVLSVLRFFDKWIEPGEYIVVEDGIIAPMGDARDYGGGPHAAIVQFLEERSGDYEIDFNYCDWFGLNVTWNVNGYLRRTSKNQVR
jgi:cephalosporin hydroxylase